MAITKIQAGALPADVITTAAIDDASITHAKLHTTMDLSSKTVTLPSAITDTITNKLPLAGGTMTGDLTVEKSAPYINISNSAENIGGIKMYDNGGAATQYFNLTYDSGASNTVGFDTGASGEYTFSVNTDEKMRIDSSGNVGIGQSVPVNKLHVSGADGYAYLKLTSDSTGHTDADGSRIGLNGSNLRIINAEAASILFQTQNTERMRINSSGGVGINTNDAIEYMFDVGRDDLAYTSGKTMRINSSGDTIFSLSRQGTSLMSMRNDATGYTCISSNNSSKLMLGFGTGDAGAINNHLYFTSGETIVNDLGQDRDFRVESDTNTHALFVDGGADMVCFGTSNNTGLAVQNSETGVQITSSGRIFCSNADHHDFNRTSNGDIIRFRRDTTVVGTISSTTAGTTYNTTSDRRLKDNIEPIADATDKLMDMKPVTHTWIADPEAPQVHGFIAQEMQEVIPEAVSGDAESDEMMSMDYGRITPVIVAALQDALNEIKELKTRIDELESK